MSMPAIEAELLDLTDAQLVRRAYGIADWYENHGDDSSCGEILFVLDELIERFAPSLAWKQACVIDEGDQGGRAELEWRRERMLERAERRMSLDA